MARVVVGSYMVRYPLGGMLSWALQYLVGFARLGHEVYFVEKGCYPDSCFHPLRGEMTDDCRYGVRVLRDLLSRFGLENNWSFVDSHGQYHGLSRPAIEEILGTADVFFDMGTHGGWLDETSPRVVRVLIDGEPAFTQLKMVRKQAGQPAAEPGRDPYDFYYTTGRNIGTPASTAPTAGREWRHLPHPVCLDVFPVAPAPPDGAYTTVMNWQSYEPVEFGGVRYGHKDVEFQRFMSLPGRTRAMLEVAVSGGAPRDELTRAGWRIRSAHDVTLSFDSFADYIRQSRGEFSVCKHGYVASNSGWFSERSAAYLATGRPVVLQETGFSAHLPTGCGLFAVGDVNEAAAAIAEIEADYRRQSGAAREIAAAHLDARRVLSRLLDEVSTSVRSSNLVGAGT